MSGDVSVEAVLTKFGIDRAGMTQVRQRIGRGLLNLAFAIQADAMREAPVRGGYRSFMTTKRGKAGQVLIGGTLRRSIHAVAYQDGKVIPGSATHDGNGRGIPEHGASGTVAYVGTNSGYGEWVEGGTVKMAARPFLGPAYAANMPKAKGIIMAAIHDGGAGVKPPATPEG